VEFRRAKAALCNRNIRLPEPKTLKQKSYAQVAPSVKQQAVKRGAGELKLDKNAFVEKAIPFWR
jgi:hypothetical protein